MRRSALPPVGLAEDDVSEKVGAGYRLRATAAAQRAAQTTLGEGET